MSILYTSIGIGLVLGWAGAPRPLANLHVWLLSLAIIALDVILAVWISPARMAPALMAAAAGWSLRTLWLGALSLKSKGT